jgi:hypothetical protein
MASSRSVTDDLGAGDESIDAEERFHGKGGGRGGGGVGRGGNAGKSRRPAGREMEVSKALSKLLRHAAEEQGIKLDEEGYAPLEQVVSNDFIYSICSFFYFRQGISPEVSSCFKNQDRVSNQIFDGHMEHICIK